MLIQLNIKNFALIEEVNMEFKEGFNILSGETGAGKSILIDAFDFVLGGKFSKDIIRTNADKTFVEAIFSIDNDKIKSILDELEIEYEDILIISRESTLSGKNVIKVNGKSLIVMQLKKIREKILDIHGQHQNQNLLQRSIHIEYLDNYIGEKKNEPLKNFLKLKEDLSEVIDRFSKINGEEGNEKLIDYTKFQIDDIEKAKLKSGEEEELKMEYEKLSNAEKINSALRVSFGLLNSREDGNSILECLSKVISELSSVSNNVKDIEEKKQAIEEAYYILEESSRDIRDMAEEIVYDEDKLSKINERIYEINTYKKKYGKTVEEVIEYYNSLCKQYDDLINAKEVIKKLELEKEEILLKMKKEGEILHKLRVNSKQLLETKILDELAYVGLDKSRMEIQVNMSENYNERGFDEVAFFISTNPGEPLKPLEKVLSGGELSRIMLALKCVFADKEEISTLIFDEIDTGISGQVGQRVGEKMYQVSLGHQVLCITHLPQIAILSDYHYFVSKEVVDGKTYTKVKLLEEEDKVKQVASMLGGDDITDTTIKNVREMLEFSINKKNEIKNFYNS